MAISKTNIQQLYVAYYGRPADPRGLAYWLSATEAASAAGQADDEILLSVSNSFGASAEYTSNFTGLNSDGIINKVYQNLFSHAPDASGLLYWSQKLASGALTLAQIVRAVSDSAVAAGNLDGIAYTSKVTAAETFTDHLDTTTEILGYSGAAAGALVKAWLTGVNSAATLATAIAGVDATVQAVTDAGNVVAGQTFSLTAGIDSVVGTAGNDTVNGAVLDSLSALDAIDGGKGVDTMTVLVSFATPASVTVKNVENLNISANGPSYSIDVSGYTGLTAITVGGAATSITVTEAASMSTTLAGNDKAQTLVTGAGVDSVVGGGGADVITAGKGADKITLSGTTSKIIQTAGDSGSNTSTTIQTAELTSTFDVVYGAADGLRLDLGNANIGTANLTTAGTNLAAGAQDTAVFARGAYDASAGTFTFAANGADTAVTYDSSSAAGVTAETIILVAYVPGASTAVGGIIGFGNVAPTLGGAVASQAVNDNATLNPFSNFTVTDPDSGASETVTITLDAAAKGVFTPASLSASGFSTANAGLSYTHAPGTPGALQNAIRSLVFQPTVNRVTPGSTETTTFTVSVSDGLAAAVTNSTTTVVASAVNDAPTLTATGGTPTFTQGSGSGVDLFSSVTAATNDTGQTFTDAVLSVSNVADSTEYLTIGGTEVALTNAASGTISGVGRYGVAVSAGTATVTLSGMTQSDANMGALIDAISYKNSDSTATAGSRVVTLTTVTDSGASSHSAAVNRAATVTVAVPDAPPHDTTAPVIASAIVNGNILVLSYTEATALDYFYLLEFSTFAVSGNTVSDVAVNPFNNTVTLMLATPVLTGATVTVTYTDPTADNDLYAIQDVAGNDAATPAAET